MINGLGARPQATFTASTVAPMSSSKPAGSRSERAMSGSTAHLTRYGWLLGDARPPRRRACLPVEAPAEVAVRVAAG